MSIVLLGFEYTHGDIFVPWYFLILHRTMPLCDGRPDGPCPSRRNDSSVRHSQGDLMLCPSCDEYRFPPVNKVISSAVTVGTVAAAAATIYIHTYIKL